MNEIKSVLKINQEIPPGCNSHQSIIKLREQDMGKKKKVNIANYKKVLVSPAPPKHSS